MTTVADIFSKIEVHQRSAIESINGATSDCSRGNKPLYEIGDQLVYLKYYVACCFQVEKDAMINFGYLQYENHRRNHDNVLDDLNDVLKQCTLPESEGTAQKSKLLAAVITVLGRLQEHIAKHNRELIAFLNKQVEQTKLTAPVTGAKHQHVQQELAHLEKYLNKGGRTAAAR